MSYFVFRRRRRVREQHVTTLLRNLEVLAPAFGLPPSEHAAFVQDVFVTMTGEEPASVIGKAVGAAEASRMEARLSHAAAAVTALSDFAGTGPRR